MSSSAKVLMQPQNIIFGKSLEIHISPTNVPYTQTHIYFFTLWESWLQLQ